VAWRPGPGRQRDRSSLLYWPLAWPFLLAAVLIATVLVALLLVGALTYALARLGIPPATAALVFLGCLLGSAINIPVARLHATTVRIEPWISAFGIRYFVPVRRDRSTVLAVNVGGALIPAALSGYLIVHDRLGWRALAAVAVVGAAVFLIARPVPGLGIAVPALLPGLFAVAAAVAFHPAAVAGLAYVSGTLGTLAGADLLNLGRVRRLGAPVASIGGAGTFDGVFVAGITAVLLASLL